MKQMKRMFIMVLAVVMLASVMVVPAFAANTADTDFWYHVATTSNFPRIPGRVKTDTSAVYVYVDQSTYSFVRVEAIGQATTSPTCPNYQNCTYYGGTIVPFVRCNRDVGYSVSSMINEYSWPYATLGFQSAGTSSDTVTGWWSADSSRTHNTPLAP